VGQATVTVSGKLAQFGSRLLVPVSDAMLAQFADNFRAAAALQPATTAGSGSPAAPGAPTAAVEAADTPTASTSTTAPAVATGSSAPVAPSRPVVVAPPVKELNALGLMWTVIKGWFAGLFGRKA
jgi:hypothetical protein